MRLKPANIKALHPLQRGKPPTHEAAEATTLKKTKTSIFSQYDANTRG